MEENKQGQLFDEYLLKLIEAKKCIRNFYYLDLNEYNSDIEIIEGAVREKIKLGRENSIDFATYINKLNEVIEKIKEENNTYQSNKKTALASIQSQNDSLLSKKAELDNEYKKETSKIKNLKVNLRKLYVRAIAFALGTPLIGSCIWGGVSAIFFKENKVSTKTYNYITNEMIKEPTESYSNNDYNFKVSAKKYFPWVKKDNGSGYTREVIEFNYIEKDVNKVLETAKPQIHVEEKDEITSEDNVSDIEIIITESKMDKSVTRPFMVNFYAYVVWGYIYVFMMTVLPKLKRKYREPIKDAKKELQDQKIVIKRILESYETIGNEVVTLQEEYDKETLTYGDLEKAINPELIDTVNKYVKR